MNLFPFRSDVSAICGLSLLVLLPLDSKVWGQDLSHRESNLTITVQDVNGNAISDATVNVKMTKHAFKFGTQIRDRFFSITETEFNSLNTTQKQGLLPDLTSFGTPRYTPTWQDALNYREAVTDNFNHVIPTVGMQWLSLNSNGPAVPDAAITQAQSNGLTVTGASVVWQRDKWPTPTQFRSDASPDPTTFHNALIADRLGPAGVMTRFSDTGAGPTITDWKVLNEPLNENYYASVFVGAGIYPTENHALADYFIRAEALRPDATLWINEFNILNSSGNANTIAYRDLVNNLLALGAPIDRIGVQAHMALPGVTKQQITDRLDILAQTGLPIEISEFDMRDDANQLSVAEQEQMFQNVLEAAFEHESVDGFNMWGFWDPGHWRGNGPLFDDAWNVKDEASPWYDLVQGAWMTELNGLPVDGQGSWSGDVIDGTYDIEVTVGGQTTTYSGYELTDDTTFVLPFIPGDVTGDGFVGIADLNVVLGNWNTGTPPTASGNPTIPEPATLVLMILGGTACLRRKR
jgi:GH35 family endo-1,4-beta-xylanase